MAATPTPTWEQRIQAVSHILTHPTPTPSLHSQLFISSRIPPSFHRFDYYPPLNSSPNSDILLWSFSLFLRRLRPLSSWRSKCPFQQPPPLVLSAAVDPAPATWGLEERRGYFRKRLRRGRLGIKVPPWFAVAAPNLAILMGLFWDPMWTGQRPRDGALLRFSERVVVDHFGALSDFD